MSSDDKNTMDQARETAMRVLGIDEETAGSNCKAVPEIDGFYFWESARGGAALLLNADGEKLAATSSVSFDEHLSAFLSGKRN